MRYSVDKLFIFVLLSFFLIGCNGQQHKKNIEEQKYTIPDSIYSFFPDGSNRFCKMKIESIATAAEENNIPYFATEFAISFISKIYINSDIEDISKFQKEYKSLAKNIIKSESSDYFIIGSERELVTKYDTVTLKNKYQKFYGTELIINFHEILNRTEKFYDSTTTCGLPKGYIVLVLKSGNDYIMPEKYRTEWKILPENIRHGYRSGVAYKDDEPYIIYWVVSW